MIYLVCGGKNYEGLTTLAVRISYRTALECLREILSRKGWKYDRYYIQTWNTTGEHADWEHKVEEGLVCEDCYYPDNDIPCEYYVEDEGCELAGSIATLTRAIAALS